MCPGYIYYICVGVDCIFTSWWFFTNPIWKNMRTRQNGLIDLPQFSGWKFQKILWQNHHLVVVCRIYKGMIQKDSGIEIPSISSLNNSAGLPFQEMPPFTSKKRRDHSKWCHKKNSFLSTAIGCNWALDPQNERLWAVFDRQGGQDIPRNNHDPGDEKNIFRELPLLMTI